MTCLLNGDNFDFDAVRIDNLFSAPTNLNLVVCVGSDTDAFMQQFTFAARAVCAVQPLAVTACSAVLSPLYMPPYSPVIHAPDTPLTGGYRSSISTDFGMPCSPCIIPDDFSMCDFSFLESPKTCANMVTAPVADAFVDSVDCSGISAPHIDFLITFLKKVSCSLEPQPARLEHVSDSWNNAEVLRRQALANLRVWCMHTLSLTDDDVTMFHVFLDAFRK